MYRKFHINKDERGLLFRKGDFVCVLQPGDHVFFDPLKRYSVEKFALAKPYFDHRLAEYIRKAEPDLVSREFHVVEVGATEVGLRYEDGVLVEVQPVKGRGKPKERRLAFAEIARARVQVEFNRKDEQLLDEAEDMADDGADEDIADDDASDEGHDGAQ
jgi:hypothetical protein